MTDDHDAPVPPLTDDNTLVLLGAGASVGAGFPTSAQLHEILRERLDPVYANLASLVFQDGGTVDPERVFRVLEFLNCLDNPTISFTNELGSEARDLAALVDTWQPDIGEYLKTSKQRLQGGAIQRTIDRLWQVLVEIFSLRDPPTNPRFEYLRHLASQMRGQTIVTLNYDDALEHMAYGTTFRVDSDPFPRPLSGTVARLNAPLRLVKLHGSLNWSRDNTSGDLKVLPPMQSFRHSQELWTGHTPGIIFGAGNKLRPDRPFLALYQEFLEALAAARQVVIIGYSFRDSHVNAAIRRWILEQAGEDALLRVGDVGDGLQPIVKSWIDRRSLDVEYIGGPAEETMKKLIAPRPQLLKPKRRSSHSSQ